eukprot:CAMPEP_0198141752 /NCGR_PEP_ID=MMETSP1443-20131203/4696_1 /TAXON_ID=186043 /ORGANISM="Entomoneis sp., Strain CCMP2396" /LENGTH=275 /DNA_ID=CAMNT_0043804581 /DNA_START=55 /DNA_END=882 /DNA_ORIENTATION=+
MSSFSSRQNKVVPNYFPKESSNDGNWDTDNNGSEWDNNGTWDSTTASTLLPSWAGLFFKSFLVTTVALYALNQKHLLPLNISRVVSKALFWPTIPITYLKRGRNNWITKLDDTVVMGGTPFGFAGLPEKLYQKYDVRGVINLCEEYDGPIQKYKQLGMTELHLPTQDHYEPNLKDLRKAVDLIQKFEKEGKRVYVHCRAGNGRSAAAVFCYLLKKDRNVNRKDLNEQLCKLRSVRKTLWKQPNIQRYHDMLHEQHDEHFSDAHETELDVFVDGTK